MRQRCPLRHDALAEPLLALRPSVTLTDTVNANVAGGALIVLLLTGTGETL